MCRFFLKIFFIFSNLFRLVIFISVSFDILFIIFVIFLGYFFMVLFGCGVDNVELYVVELKCV